MLNEKVTDDGLRCYVCNRYVHVFVEQRSEGAIGVGGKHGPKHGYPQDERVSLYRPGGRKPLVSMGLYALRELISDLQRAEQQLVAGVEQDVVDVANRERGDGTA